MLLDFPNVNAPATGFTGTSYARFRVSTDTGLDFDGQASDGEVEDYQVTIRDDNGGPSAVLDVTGNGSANPFQDGIIIVRLMLAQPDANLEAAALIPGDATRTTGARLETSRVLFGATDDDREELDLSNWDLALTGFLENDMIPSGVTS